MENLYFQALVRDLAQLEAVEAILLAGSRATQMADAKSDYDVYVYVSAELPLAIRQPYIAPHCVYVEWQNQFWETEDNGRFLDHTEFDLIYRSLDWLDGELDRILYQHQASTGYTTCLWFNLLNATVLFDRNGRAVALQQKYTIPYPQPLKQAIIRKNYALLQQQMPAYYHQIKKAVQRNDLVSTNHRLAEFLASYFDILFALNEQPHPGEKRLIAQVQTCCTQMPANFSCNINNLVRFAGQFGPELLAELDETIAQLDMLLAQNGLVTSNLQEMEIMSS